ncbi:unnamed protein product [Rhizoctonia solani]|uniref:Uncharacterized protein n=1 Tax=Rhizoctonia solani TaxID=456999 RepID=A0A8H3C6F1_9AGAM|nr:unnamed protein product [Rhizoctonia solani]
MRESIRYYDLQNNSIGTIIYHKIVDANGNAIWDGRTGYPSSDSINIGQHIVFDLSKVNEDGRLDGGKWLFLSSNTVSGNDYTEWNVSFIYDQSSSTIATVSRTGTSYQGELQFKGTRQKS